MVKDTLQNVSYNYEPLFKDHFLRPIHHGAVFNNGTEMYWPAIVLFLILCLVVILKVTAPSKTTKVLNAAYSLQVARQLEREDYGPFKRVSVLLSTIFVLTTAFLFFKLNQFYGFVLEGKASLIQYLFFVLVIVIIYTIKFISISLMSYVTKSGSLSGDYINSTLIINQSVGLLLLPVMILAQLSSLHILWLVIPAVLFLIITYFLRLFRGFVFAGIEQGIGILQLFVYLCALEILPLLVVIKFLAVKF